MNTESLFKLRRSVNYFDKSKVLEESTLKEIINMAVLAPSGFNLQPWRLIAVSSEANKQKLYNLAWQQDKILEAPCTLIVVADKEGYSTSNPVWDEMLTSIGGKKDVLAGAQKAAAGLYGSSEERKIKFAESNAGLFAMSLMIAAKEKGVDSHPMSGIDFEGIHQAFGLKEDESVVMLIALGYYDDSRPIPPRRPRRGFEEITSII